MIDPELRDSRLLVSDRLLRQFAGLWLLVFGLLATHQFLTAATGRATVLAFVGLTVGLTGLVRPQVIGLLFLVAMALAAPIGWVVSHLLLGLVYYGVFAPLAFVFRVTGRDALVRKRRPTGSSYWTVKEQPSDPDRYLRQT